MDFPEWMPVAFYTRRGYREVDRQGMQVMAIKDFRDHDASPRFIQRKKSPASVSAQTTVDVFCDGWCQSMNVLADFACDLARQRGCILREYTVDALGEWDMDGEIFINGGALDLGCPDGKAVIQAAFDKIK